MLKILISHPVKNFPLTLAQAWPVFGGPVMGLWEFSLNSETTEVVLHLNIRWPRWQREEHLRDIIHCSWIYLLHVGKNQDEGSVSSVFNCEILQGFIMCWWLQQPLRLITQAPNPNIFSAQSRSILCKEEANKTFALHSEFRISIWQSPWNYNSCIVTH